MIENRKKVNNNPRVGRQGYARKAAKLKKEKGTSPGLTEVADELKAAAKNPTSAVFVLSLLQIYLIPRSVCYIGWDGNFCLII
ncbi:hypothetical protein M758_UG153300 [Ceratodon purpureus]|nr:hypothetical protein M758_UG153300 [Ceratodon purpureus]